MIKLEMRLSSLDDRPFPRAAIIGAGLMMAMTIIGVGIIQWNKHVASASVDQPAPVTSRSLRFVDAGDGVNAFGGHVRVFDARTGREYPQLRDNDGFVRAALNGLNYERTKRGISAEPVFLLEVRQGHRLALADPATGAHINLDSFGAGNEAVFLRFFDQRQAGS
jgi:putative photosynthetic complex assembly protein